MSYVANDGNVYGLDSCNWNVCETCDGDGVLDVESYETTGDDGTTLTWGGYTECCLSCMGNGVQGEGAY
jgi:hypothetical protein